MVGVASGGEKCLLWASTCRIDRLLVGQLLWPSPLFVGRVFHKNLEARNLVMLADRRASPFSRAPIFELQMGF